MCYYKVAYTIYSNILNISYVYGYTPILLSMLLVCFLKSFLEVIEICSLNCSFKRIHSRSLVLFPANFCFYFYYFLHSIFAISCVGVLVFSFCFVLFFSVFVSNSVFKRQYTLLSNILAISHRYFLSYLLD